MSDVINPADYLKLSSSPEDKVCRYDKLIALMMDAADRAALNGDIDEYWIDDGQTKIKNIYRNPSDLIAAIDHLEKLRTRALNKLTGYTTILKDRNSQCP